MLTASQRMKLLGLFQGKPTPRLYDHEHPRQLVKSDVNRFPTHLAVNEHVAAATQNQALSAILFLYEHVPEVLKSERVRPWVWAEEYGE